MHEFSLMADLIQKIEQLVQQNNAQGVSRVTVKLGALAHISEQHFREHFVLGTRGTVIENAQLAVTQDTDESAADAQDILLQSVDLNCADDVND